MQSQTVVLPSGAMISGVQLQNRPTTYKRKHEEEEELEVLSSRISLIDQVSRERIKYCAKSSKCSHISCFDFYPFITIYPALTKIFDRVHKNTNEIRFDSEDEIDPTTKKIKSFKIIHRKNKKFNTHNRKFTRKTSISTTLNCPICNVIFLPNELLFDDFMHVILNHPILKDVNQVEIDDNWNVIPVIENEHENKEVISLIDDENKKKRKRIKISDSDDELNYTDSIQILDDDDYDDDNNDDDFQIFLPNGTQNDPVVLD